MQRRFVTPFDRLQLSLATPSYVMSACSIVSSLLALVGLLDYEKCYLWEANTHSRLRRLSTISNLALLGAVPQADVPKPPMEELLELFNKQRQLQQQQQQQQQRANPPAAAQPPKAAAAQQQVGALAATLFVSVVLMTTLHSVPLPVR